MDVFKLAFETTVVGLLTLSWLGAATYLLFPEFTLDSAAKDLPDFLQKNPAALGIGVLILAYCIGSAVLPVANQLVNDEHWPLNESSIRCQVFTKLQQKLKSVGESALPIEKIHFEADLVPSHCSSWGAVFTGEKIGLGQRVKWFVRLWVGLSPWTGTESDEAKVEKILTIFELQEAAVLSQPSDRTESLRQLHERIVVLRGTVFSGLILFLICLFAYFARVNGTSSWIRPTCGAVLAVAFTVFAFLNGYQDLKNHNIFDVPVLESIMVVVTIFGVVLVVRKPNNAQFRSKRYLLIALFFTGLAYGGWMWSETIYDQQVINSFVALQKNPAAAKQ